MKHVVVTGVSSGIGTGIARLLIAKGFHVLGSVRKEADAARLEKALAGTFTPLVFDTRDEDAVAAAAEQVGRITAGRSLFGLINNAGIAIPGPVLLQPVGDFRAQIDTNLVGTFIVTQAFLPLLGAGRAVSGPPGRIVNITSLGGKIGAPFLGGYCAAKHGVEGLSETLRRELIPFGIDVIVVAPGAVRTPIWNKASQGEGLSRYGRSDYAAALKNFSGLLEGGERRGLAVERVAQLVHRALTVRRPKTRYVLAPSFILDWMLPTCLPSRWVDRFVARRLSLRRLESFSGTI